MTVRAHWSLLIIAFLLADGLATGVLPATVKGESTQAYWGVGLAVAFLFLVSLLAHEVAHAVVARRRGLRVTGITLWALGGVTALEESPTDPATDLRVAVVGPAVSFACGAAAALAAAGLHAVDAPRLLVAGAVWLATTNGLLAVFNLLPGAPLDGGRVLRAALWRRSGDRDAAELTAARVGRATGTVLIGLGLLDVLGTGDLVGGLWLMVVGWFLSAASTGELRAAEIRRTLAGLRVRDVMDEPAWLTAYQSAAAAAAHVTTVADRDWYVVVDIDGHPVGVVGVDRLVHAALRPAAATRVADVMVPLNARSRARPDDALADAVVNAGPGMPVVAVEDERAVGIVTPQRTALAVRRAQLTTAGLPG